MRDLKSPPAFTFSGRRLYELAPRMMMDGGGGALQQQVAQAEALSATTEAAALQQEVTVNQQHGHAGLSMMQTPEQKKAAAARRQRIWKIIFYAGCAILVVYYLYHKVSECSVVGSSGLVCALINAIGNIAGAIGKAAGDVASSISLFSVLFSLLLVARIFDMFRDLFGGGDKDKKDGEGGQGDDSGGGGGGGGKSGGGSGGGGAPAVAPSRFSFTERFLDLPVVERVQEVMQESVLSTAHGEALVSLSTGLTLCAEQMTEWTQAQVEVIVPEESTATGRAAIHVFDNILADLHMDDATLGDQFEQWMMDEILLPHNPPAAPEPPGPGPGPGPGPEPAPAPSQDKSGGGRLFEQELVVDYLLNFYYQAAKAQGKTDIAGVLLPKEVLGYENVRKALTMEWLPNDAGIRITFKAPVTVYRQRWWKFWARDLTTETPAPIVMPSAMIAEALKPQNTTLADDNWIDRFHEKYPFADFARDSPPYRDMYVAFMTVLRTYGLGNGEAYRDVDLAVKQEFDRLIQSDLMKDGSPYAPYLRAWGTDFDTLMGFTAQRAMRTRAEAEAMPEPDPMAPGRGFTGKIVSTAAVFNYRSSPEYLQRKRNVLQRVQEVFQASMLRVREALTTVQARYAQLIAEANRLGSQDGLAYVINGMRDLVTQSRQDTDTETLSAFWDFVVEAVVKGAGQKNAKEDVQGMFDAFLERSRALRDQAKDAAMKELSDQIQREQATQGQGQVPDEAGGWDAGGAGGGGPELLRLFSLGRLRRRLRAARQGTRFSYSASPSSKAWAPSLYI